MSDRVINIIVNAKDNASAGLKNVGGALGDIGKFALGGVLAQGITSIGGAIVQMGRDAFGSVANTERLSMALTTMLSKEIHSAGVLKERIKVGTANISVTEGEIKSTLKKGQSVDDVKFKIDQLNVQLAVQRQRLAEATAKGKESQEELAARSARIAAMERNIGKLTTSMGVEGTTVSKSVAIYKEQTKETVTWAEAKKKAAEESQKLLKWIERLAVQSPFSQEDVAKSIKMGMAYGFTSEEAKRLTMANINFASATGASGDVMERVSLALGQVRAKGKLAGGEMLQLTEAGIPMREILLDSGKVAGLTAENFDKMQSKGLIPAKAAMEAYTEYVEKNFNTAAKDQAGSLSGLVASLGDLKDIALRDFFGGIFRSAQPYLDKFVTVLGDPAIQANIKAIGENIGAFVGGALSTLFGLVQTFSTSGVQGVGAALGIDPATVAGVVGLVNNQLIPAVASMATWFQANLPIALQTLSTYWTTTLQPVLSALAAFLVEALPIAIQAVATVWTTVLQPALAALAQWLAANIPVAIQTASTVWTTVLQPALAAFGTFLTTTVFPFLQKLGVWLEKNMPAFIATASAVWNDVLLPAIKGIWSFLSESLFPLFKAVAEFVGAVLGKRIEEMAATWETQFLPALREVDKFLRPFLSDVLDKLGKALEWIKGVIDGLINTFNGWTQAVQNFKLPAVLTPGSPTPMEMGLRGILGAMNELNGAGLPNFGQITSPQMAYAGARGGNAPASAPAGRAQIVQVLMPNGKVLAETVVDDGAGAMFANGKRSYRR